MKNFEDSLLKLKEGNKRFLSEAFSVKDHIAEDRLELSKGQHPFAVVLCCSDSRVVPEIIFDCKLGELFVIRNAGNVVDEDVLGSVEYAVEHLGTPLVVVMGHSCCGAVTATCEGGVLPGNLPALVKRIKPSISPECCIDDNARRHALRMAQLLKEDPVVSHCHAEVMASFYDIKNGEVSFF